MTLKVKSFLHIVGCAALCSNESSQFHFQLLYHRIFNIIMVKTTWLLTFIKEYPKIPVKTKFSHIFIVINTIKVNDRVHILAHPVGITSSTKQFFPKVKELCLSLSSFTLCFHIPGNTGAPSLNGAQMQCTLTHFSNCSNIDNTFYSIFQMRIFIIYVSFSEWM